jgi:hypothetical protein
MAPKLEQMKDVVEKLKPYIEKVGPIVKQGNALYKQHSPQIKKGMAFVQEYVHPELALALMLLFFGGQFALTVCAYRAFQASGGRLVKQAWADLSDTYREGMTALRKDAEMVKLFDADGDGHVTPTEVAGMVITVVSTDKKEDRQQKLQVLAAMLKCVDPQKILDAVSGFWAGLAAVLATLRSEVARYVTIGTVLGTRAAGVAHEKTADKLLEKYPQYKQWIEAGYKCAGTVLGIMLAFLLTRTIMAVNSALEGGRKVCEFALAEAQKRQMVTEDQVKLYGDHAAYGLAAFGFLFQFYYGFSVPWYLFPLKLALMPVLLVESGLAFVAFY